MKLPINCMSQIVIFMVQSKWQVTDELLIFTLPSCTVRMRLISIAEKVSHVSNHSQTFSKGVHDVHIALQASLTG